MAKSLPVRRRAALSVRVLSASGRAVPNVRVRLAVGGAGGLPAQVDTGDDGIARPSFTPAGVQGGLRVTATGVGLAASLPKVFVPCRPDAARNGQRLAVSASATVSATAVAAVRRAQLTVTTKATPATLLAGEPSRDAVTIGGAFAGWRGQVEVRLYGPFRSQAAISCAGAPLTTRTYETGSGPSMTPPIMPPGPGWYAYELTIASSEDVAGGTTPCPVAAEMFKVETQPVAATDAHGAAVTGCGEASETTFVQAKPAVTTVVSDAVVQPGSSIFDRIAVTGLGGTPVTIEVQRHGPFASRAAIDCTGTPYWEGRVKVDGDGDLSSAKVRLKHAGFYTYRERIDGTASVAATETACGEEAPTSLAAPLILTGGRTRVAQAQAAAAAPATRSRPTRVRLAARGIDAPVFSADIDLRSGALAVPRDIDRVGWWRDGAAPGAANGAILLAGHIDSAKRGAGAFYALRNARRGDRVTVTRQRQDPQLPRHDDAARAQLGPAAELYSRTGPRRLVLVTCGGPFDEASGHYRDNVVVTAVPR